MAEQRPVWHVVHRLIADAPKDSINTSQGVKTIAGISLPGATTDDRKFESVCLDDNGNILVHITFSDGSTSLLLGQ